MTMPTLFRRPPRYLMPFCTALLLTACNGGSHEAAAAHDHGSAPLPSPAEQADAMAHQHGNDSPVASPLAEQAVPADSIDSSTVTYGNLDGQALSGYLAKPKGASGALPGVIVFHEWWGLNDNIRHMADQLAAKGYIALAADMYGGHSVSEPAQAQALMQNALNHTPVLDRNIESAFDYLKNQAHAAKIGTVGWCFGGSMSFEAAQVLSGKLNATVIYYGFVNDQAEALDKIKAPVLGLFGGKDQGIPVSTVEAFRKGLEARQAPAIVHVYDDAGHAFANPSGKNYVAADAEDAWKRTLDFFGENLAN